MIVVTTIRDTSGNNSKIPYTKFFKSIHFRVLRIKRERELESIMKKFML